MSTRREIFHEMINSLAVIRGFAGGISPVLDQLIRHYRKESGAKELSDRQIELACAAVFQIEEELKKVDKQINILRNGGAEDAIK